jgi:hypothetical protein
MTLCPASANPNPLSPRGHEGATHSENTYKQAPLRSLSYGLRFTIRTPLRVSIALSKNVIFTYLCVVSGSSLSTASVPITRSGLAKKCRNCFTNKETGFPICTNIQERGRE